jgi:flagellar hook-basal body complex protein FliE
MSLAISSIQAVTPLASSSSAAGSAAAGKAGGFSSLLEGAIQSVEQPRAQASQAVQNLLNGDEELHTVALAAQKAELTFELGLQVRNKVVAAYQEVMRMQI